MATPATCRHTVGAVTPTLSVVLGLLLVSCDKRVLPTQPTGPEPVVLPPRSTGPIAFVSDRDGTNRIYLANEDGSAVTPLIAGDAVNVDGSNRRSVFNSGGHGSMARDGHRTDSGSCSSLAPIATGALGCGP